MRRAQQSTVSCLCVVFKFNLALFWFADGLFVQLEKLCRTLYLFCTGINIREMFCVPSVYLDDEPVGHNEEATGNTEPCDSSRFDPPKDNDKPPDQPMMSTDDKNDDELKLADNYQLVLSTDDDNEWVDEDKRTMLTMMGNNLRLMLVAVLMKKKNSKCKKA